MELRPLSIGELMDRAVTICVRNFPMLAFIYLLFILPVTLLQAFGHGEQGNFFTVLPDIVRAGQGDPNKPIDPKVLSKIVQYSSFDSYTLLWVLAMLFVRELPIAALMIAVSHMYLGTPVSWKSAYREALRSWLPLIGTTFLYIGVSLLFCLAAVSAFLTLMLGAVMLAMLVPQIAVVLEILAGALFLLAFILLALLLWVSLYTAYLTCVLEHKGPLSSFGQALQRCFSRLNFRRSAAVAFAFGAIACGVVLVGVVVSGLLNSIANSNLLGTIFNALLSIVFMVSITALFVVHYYDVRIRREGFDLQHEVTTLATCMERKAPLA